MDLTRTVSYRQFLLNHLEVDLAQPGRMIGSEIKTLHWPGVLGHGYDEKRALADGFDASDVFLGKRLIQMEGALYDMSRMAFYDRLQQFIEACTPTAAYADSPGDRGFLPLDYYVPTADTANWPLNVIRKMVLARPTRQPDIVIADDAHGGSDVLPLSARWSAEFYCRDPRVYSFDPLNVLISATAGAGSGSFVNRGDYPTPLNMQLLIVANSPAGSFHFTGGGTDMTITIPHDPLAQIIRYSGHDKVLTLEVNSVEATRMDLLTFAGQATHPLVAPGSTSYTWTLATADLAVGGMFWYWEAWA